MINSRIFSAFLLSAFSVFLANNADAAESKNALSVSSTAISPGAAIDKKFTGDGADVSPPLSWSAGPAATKSYAISCEDPDAPLGTWWHWILFNITPQTHQVSENVPKVAKLAGGVTQGANDFGKPGYNGPSPPPGKVHHYVFKVMALDTVLNLKPNCDKDAFKKALNAHILAEGQLVGTYKR